MERLKKKKKALTFMYAEQIKEKTHDIMLVVVEKRA